MAVEHITTVYRLQIGTGSQSHIAEICEHVTEGQPSLLDLPAVEDLSPVELREYAQQLLRLAGQILARSAEDGSD